MYSVVVLMALQGTVDVPDFGRRGGGGCCGCYGGGGRRGGRHGGCGGGYGGCYGGGYGGCYGGGYGGCYGGGYGGGYVCGGGYGYGGGCYGGAVMPYGSGAQPMPGPGPVTPKKSGLDNTAPATIVVTVPAGAELKIDDYVARSSATERTFETPPLQVGKAFSYTLKAKHNGKETSQTVIVRGGEVTRVNLSPTGSSVAAR